MADDNEVGKRKKKDKPVDIINTPDIPFYKFGTPPKCHCLGQGYCWKPCKMLKSDNDNRNRNSKSNRNEKDKDEPDIRTWHPDS